LNWEALGASAEALGAVGVILTLLYLAIQIRTNTRVVRAQSRHSISEFIQRLTQFRAVHSERLAKINASEELSPADAEFLAWAHVEVVLLGETYHYHHELGMMPSSHWRGFVRFFRGYMDSPGFDDAWARFAPTMAEEFTAWVNEERAQLGLVEVPVGTAAGDAT
jgi:hypothetical protein